MCPFIHFDKTCDSLFLLFNSSYLEDFFGYIYRGKNIFLTKYRGKNIKRVYSCKLAFKLFVTYSLKCAISKRKWNCWVKKKSQFLSSYCTDFFFVFDASWLPIRGSWFDALILKKYKIKLNSSNCFYNNKENQIFS
jgi:hypothetical protein